MNNIKFQIKKYFLYLCVTVTMLLTTISCNDNYLNEVPRDFLSTENVFTDVEGFEAAITGCYNTGRMFIAGGGDVRGWEILILYGYGTDIGWFIDKISHTTDYSTINSSMAEIQHYWDQCFSLVSQTNLIISRAEGEGVDWSSEEEKNRIIAEARFFRAYAYRLLVWLWGDVPIITEEIDYPKLDFVRTPKADVLNFIIGDLEFASQHLPQTNPTGARLSKAAADYLLAETYISIQQWDKAIEASNRILSDSQYDLMYERFGSMTDKPGDVYWDLFRLGNQDRRSGNKENIFAWQMEYQVVGGGGAGLQRAWGPFLERLRTPDNMQAILKDEFLGRPVGWQRTTNWVENEMWNDYDNDIRNSEYNLKREYYINNPASAYYGQKLELTPEDLERNAYPFFQKFTHPYGAPQGYDRNGEIMNDWYAFRVAGVYLLRAEAYLGKGQKDLSAADINAVRGRANAAPVAAADVDIDYILDERVRELIGEEQRRITLCRTGKLVERVKLHNPVSGPTIQDFNILWPIPQTEIDANSGSDFPQNPGYN